MSAAVLGEDGLARCPGGGGSGVLRDYHDTEWGVPIRGETAMFERLSLEGAQAGLSWLTILNKRESYRRVFHGFEVDAVAAMTDADLEEALLDPGIVRNRGKVLSVRRNARACVELRAEGGLEQLIEGFAPSRTPVPRTTAQLPTTSP